MAIEMFVGLCATSKDLCKYKNSIALSFNNLAEAFHNNIFFFVVAQGETLGNSFFETCKNPVSVQHEKFLGVSNARNLCINKAEQVGAKYILFHDASIYWAKSAANFIYTNRAKNPKVHVSFSNDVRDNHTTFLNRSGHAKKINPIYHTYVWSYLFLLKDVSSLRFNIDFGPGENTQFKSGEDVLFLFDVFNFRSDYSVFESDKSITVYHPPRESNYSKHLLYAFGQGKIFKELLTNNRSWRIYIDTLLFFGNAVFRCLLFKENSFKILCQRIYGFLS